MVEDLETYEYSSQNTPSLQDSDSQREEYIDVTPYLHVVDAFEVPRWKYNFTRKNFSSHPDKPQLFATAGNKASLFRDRHDLLRQRILRNENFVPPAFSNRDKGEYVQLTAISSLLGREDESFFLFGMLTQMEDGKYYLEDLDSHVQLDFEEAHQTTGFFTEGCFVLVDGVYTEDNIFKVKTIGLPPPERREITKSVFGQVNFFGAPDETLTMSQLKKIEESQKDVCFVILSDVWLDHPMTIPKLRTLLTGYANALIPLAFILMGNFVSEPFLYTGKDSATYKEYFNALGSLIGEFKELCQHSHFIFVPGPHDPWGGDVLPRPPIPEHFTSQLRRQVPNAIFASNPCRIKYCTQEIVIFREDLINKMRRNCVIKSRKNGESDVKKHLIRTIIDEAHLCPLPLHVRPISWSYDHALRLYPIPNTLILADKFDPFSVNYEGCQCVNPGSFVSTEFQFQVYYPGKKLVQLSQLPPS
ncbi:DNA-directed DNA polymerase epsilon, subunit B [Basidiobolus ranarum]|uniref:DNA polymerase epsilon subunit B n=1 Tax=Basidiobolus ranarum TaxID=34480 RepID=A0ABR2WPH1_9FUNG